MLGTDILWLLALATAALVIGASIGVPAIAAYLVAGVLAGPGVLGVVHRSEGLQQIAELGVALLLFGVGIEFSLDRLRLIVLKMLASGGLQVGFTICAAAGLFAAVGMPLPQAIFVGFLIALSSTAIIFKLYEESGEMDAPQGRAAASILLFQDLALVPMTLLVPVLAHPGDVGVRGAALALVAAAVTLVVLLLLARAVLPRVLAFIARAGNPDLFPLSALVIAFGTAACAVQLGLSLPIGAFLAGLALSGSPYAHQVFAEIIPLRDAFVAIFFTSIGLLFDPGIVTDQPALLGLMVGAVSLKAVVTGVVVALVWRSARLGILAGLGLAQIGEFSFVLADTGARAGVIDESVRQAFLGTAILSMAATPFLVRLARRYAFVAEGEAATGPPSELRHHVIVVGCGTTGQAIARVLKETGVRFVAIDLLAENVEEAERKKLRVRFGDASRRGVLEEIGVREARAVVVTVGDPISTRRIVGLIRQANHDARIIVRARRVDEIEELERLGANDVVPSEFETSVELFMRVLQHLGVPRHVARVQESLIRLHRYQALRGGGMSDEMLADTKRLIAGGILETAEVMQGSAAAGKTLAELALRDRTGALILNIVRNEQPLPTPDASTRLEAGDLVVLYGPHEAIDRALHLFEPAA